MNDFKVGQLLFNVRCTDEMENRNQHITCFIDGGYLDADGRVRAQDGTLVDFFEDGIWFTSKEKAIEETIRQLEEMINLKQDPAKYNKILPKNLIADED